MCHACAMPLSEWPRCENAVRVAGTTRPRGLQRPCTPSLHPAWPVPAMLVRPCTLSLHPAWPVPAMPVTIPTWMNEHKNGHAAIQQRLATAAAAPYQCGTSHIWQTKHVQWQRGILSPCRQPGLASASGISLEQRPQRIMRYIHTQPDRGRVALCGLSAAVALRKTHFSVGGAVSKPLMIAIT